MKGMTMKLSPQQRIQRAHVAIASSKEFCLLSGVVLCGNSCVDDSVPTACTDGWNVRYGSAFVNALDEKEFNFVVVHEAFHKMYKQLYTWEKLFKEDPRTAGMACDYVINLQIVDLDPHEKIVVMPKGEHAGLLDEKFRGMDVRQVYELLRQEKQDDESGDGGQPGFDEHELPEDGDGDGAGGEGSEQSAADRAAAQQQRKERMEMLDQAIRQGVMLAGRMQGNVSREVGELLECKVDWREQLREFVSATCSGRDDSTWRRPNRRWMARGLYMPTTYAETMGALVVGIDTSGSIGRQELTEFLSEVAGICAQVRPEKVYLMWWDTAVAGVQVIEPEEYDRLAEIAKPAGGGGTNVSCLFSYIEQEQIAVEACVVLTDGCTPWCEAPPYPVLFGMTTPIVAPFGVTVRIEP